MKVLEMKNQETRKPFEKGVLAQARKGEGPQNGQTGGRERKAIADERKRAGEILECLSNQYVELLRIDAIQMF
jgi:hypothetical protein